jgi:hypothetical protein
MDKFNKLVNKKISGLKSNDILHSILTMSLVLYAGLAAPSLPKSISKLFDFAAFRITILSLIMWNTNDNPALSLMLAIGFVVSMNTLSGKQIFERFELIEPQTNILPGCLSIKMTDLLRAFNEDPDALQKALIKVGTPYNLPLTDENAPLLATHLINFGYKLSDSCLLPPINE